MATSDSINFSKNAQSIIQDAFYMLNAYAPGESIEPEDYELARRMLNYMIKNWQAYGIFIWTYTEAYLFPARDQRKYTLGTNGADHFTDAAVITAVKTAAASGASTLIVDSTSGMTASDNIGIELDNGTRQWMTISSVTDSTTLALSTTLTGAVAVDNSVFTYTTKAKWPMDIYQVRYYDYSDDYERPMQELSRADYNGLVDKTVEQITSAYFYDRQKNPGYFYIWPEIDNIEDYYKITYQRILHDVDSATDDLDFPLEYHLPIILNLAILLSHPLQTVVSNELRMDAKIAFDNASRNNNTKPEYVEFIINED